MIFIIYFFIVSFFIIIYYQLMFSKPKKHIEQDLNYDICMKVNLIAEKTIDTAIKLYGVKNDVDEFLNFTLKEIKIRIDNSDLTQYEKDYWTHTNIEYAYKKAIIKTLRNQNNGLHS